MFGKKEPAKKVLVVEDDALLLRVLLESLAAEKFVVTGVENGLVVVETARRFHPDIILLDLIIPGIDGFAVLKKLKADEKLKTVPVVVLSNLDNPGDVKSTSVLGAEDYFVKSNTPIEKIVEYVKHRIK